MHKALTIICISALSTACGGGSTSSNEPAPKPASAATVQTPEPEVVNPYDQSTLDYSKLQAEEQANQTAQITVSPEFTFGTSRSVNLSLDFVEARDRQATLLICTDYSKVKDVYSVDYGSCLLRASIDDGRLTHQMQILNRHDTVLGVVWFAEPGHEPLYQEIVVPSV